MDRSIAKLEPDSEAKKLERWNKIAKEAATQSGRQKIPLVEHSVKFKNIIENIEKYDILLLLYEGEQTLTLKKALQTAKLKHNIRSIAVIIGPEGGLSEEEVGLLSNYDNVLKVTLGKRILRTETAGFSAVSMIVYEFDL